MRAAAPAPAEVANGGGAEVAEEQPAKRVCLGFGYAEHGVAPNKADPLLMCA